MSDNFSPLLALAGAGVMATMGIWPMALLFLVAALVFSMTLSAQDEANKQAIAQQDPTRHARHTGSVLSWRLWSSCWRS